MPIPAINRPLTEGFGDLAAALMLAPRMARRNKLQEDELKARDERERRAISTALMRDRNQQDARSKERAEDRDLQRELAGLRSSTAAAKLDAGTIPSTILADIRKQVPVSEQESAIGAAGYSPETYRRLPAGGRQMVGSQADPDDLRAVLSGSPQLAPAVPGAPAAAEELPAMEPPDDLRQLVPAAPAPAAPRAPAPSSKTPSRYNQGGANAKTPAPSKPALKLLPEEDAAVKTLDPESAAQWQRILATGDMKRINAARARLMGR